MIEPIETWFRSKGWQPFEFQRDTWRAYLRGESGLVHAPTGMGKTYAVWLGPLAANLHEANQTNASPIGHEPGLPHRINPTLRILWITPLRALASDTAHNLQIAVDGMNIPWKVELRTGDTSQSIRKKQRTQLPPALVTTPESLSVMLSYPECSNHFRNLQCVIVDEWHELLGTKRGVQTELGLARLRQLAPMMRTWGLSATLGNLDQAMDVLLGASNRARVRSAQAGIQRATPDGMVSKDSDWNPACAGLTDASVFMRANEANSRGTLISAANDKAIAIQTLVPDEIDRFPWSGHVGTRLLPQVIERIESARTTLLFTNVRSQAEIWFQQIMKARPDLIGCIALHHGSLDRDIRTEVENLLRDGRVRCVVCTSSLDLGVDFSPVDQVMQLGSPKGIARLLQRAGRSGHQPGAVSTIIGVPTNALELLEFAAARDAIGGEARPSRDASALNHHIESRSPLDRPLDVLVQHLVTLACGDGFIADELLNEVRSTHAFAKLSDEEWNWALHFVSQGGHALKAYPQYAKIIQHEYGRYRVANKTIERLHRMSIGTITADTVYKVAFVGGPTLGTIEESFIDRLNPGDRFVFAGRVLELVRVHNVVAHVTKAKQRSGVMPKWMGAKCPLSTLLARAIRNKLESARQGTFDSAEMKIIQPLMELQSEWSVIPKPEELLIERIRSRDGHHLFIYPFEGRQVHEGLSSLIAHRIAAQAARSMHVTANDYGFELLSEEPIDLCEDEWRQVFTTQNLVDDLLACLNTTALARRAFRDIARVAGLIFSGYPGQPKSSRQLHASSQLFFDVFREFDPGNLLLDQARREVLDRELQVIALRATLERIHSSRIVMVDTPYLTPLGFPLWSESIRTQHVSSERWADRVRKMVAHLEREAARTKSETKNKHRARRAHQEHRAEIQSKVEVLDAIRS